MAGAQLRWAAAALTSVGAAAAVFQATEGRQLLQWERHGGSAAVAAASGTPDAARSCVGGGLRCWLEQAAPVGEAEAAAVRRQCCFSGSDGGDRGSGTMAAAAMAGCGPNPN